MRRNRPSGFCIYPHNSRRSLFNDKQQLKEYYFYSNMINSKLKETSSYLV